MSKWERGLNFPDIALLEPLAGLLDLTVSELLSGERGRQPQDSLVRELLRVALSQLGRSIQRWRRLFGVALAALAVLALIGGHRLLRDRTDWLPQSETLVAPVSSALSTVWQPSQWESQWHFLT